MRALKWTLTFLVMIVVVNAWAQTASFSPLNQTGKLVDSEVEKLLISATTVDEFLERLQKNSKTAHYLNRFIPIWESDSLQKSFAFCPRILMYNEDASFVMSIVGCPRLNHAQDDVEIVQWNAQEMKFELFSVHFRLNSVPVAKVEIGEKNPSECMRCHRGGIAIGAFDPYTWPGESLNYYSMNLAALYANSMTGKTAVYESNKELVRTIGGIERYKYFKVGNLLNRYPYLRLHEYGSFLGQIQSQGDWTMKGRQFTTSPTSTGFMQNTPIKKFNQLLADKNHQRTLRMARDLFGEQYDKMKFFLVSALSDCENFYKFYPANEKFPAPLSSRDAYEKLQGIYTRVGLEVMRPRIVDATNFFQNIFAVKQLDAVGKVYYGMLSMDMDDQVRDLNLNPIKFTMYPLWGSANIVEAFLDSDQDFKELRTIDGIGSGSYLRMRSGLPPEKDHALWSKWRSLAEVEKQNSRSALYDPGLQEKFGDRLDQLYFKDQNFNAYCQKIENVYVQKFGPTQVANQ